MKKIMLYLLMLFSPHLMQALSDKEVAEIRVEFKSLAAKKSAGTTTIKRMKELAELMRGVSIRTYDSWLRIIEDRETNKQKESPTLPSKNPDTPIAKEEEEDYDLGDLFKESPTLPKKPVEEKIIAPETRIIPLPAPAAPKVEIILKEKSAAGEIKPTVPDTKEKEPVAPAPKVEMPVEVKPSAPPAPAVPDAKPAADTAARDKANAILADITKEADILIKTIQEKAKRSDMVSFNPDFEALETLNKKFKDIIAPLPDDGLKSALEKSLADIKRSFGHAQISYLPTYYALKTAALSKITADKVGKIELSQKALLQYITDLKRELSDEIIVQFDPLFDTITEINKNPKGPLSNKLKDAIKAGDELLTAYEEHLDKLIVQFNRNPSLLLDKANTSSDVKDHQPYKDAQHVIEKYEALYTGFPLLFSSRVKKYDKDLAFLEKHTLIFGDLKEIQDLFNIDTQYTELITNKVDAAMASSPTEDRENLTKIATQKLAAAFMAEINNINTVMSDVAKSIALATSAKDMKSAGFSPEVQKQTADTLAQTKKTANQSINNIANLIKQILPFSFFDFIDKKMSALNTSTTIADAIKPHTDSAILRALDESIYKPIQEWILALESLVKSEAGRMIFEKTTQKIIEELDWKIKKYNSSHFSQDQKTKMAQLISFKKTIDDGASAVNGKSLGERKTKHTALITQLNTIVPKPSKVSTWTPLQRLQHITKNYIDAKISLKK